MEIKAAGIKPDTGKGLQGANVAWWQTSAPGMPVEETGWGWDGRGQEGTTGTLSEDTEEFIKVSIFAFQKSGDSLGNISLQLKLTIFSPIWWAQGFLLSPSLPSAGILSTLHSNPDLFTWVLRIKLGGFRLARQTLYQMSHFSILELHFRKRSNIKLAYD